jgi:hypothetical protein
MARVRVCVIAVAAAVLLCAAAPAATVTWSGGGADENWSTGANWGGGRAPGMSDVATFGGGSSKNCTIDVAVVVDGIDINKGYSGTITQSAGKGMEIGDSNFDQAAGTFAGGDAEIAVKNSFILSGGSFTSTSGLLKISRNLTISGGAFAHHSGTVSCIGSLHTVVNAGKTVFHNVTINTRSNYSVEVIGTMDVNGDLTITQVGNLKTGTIAVAGNVTTTDSGMSGSLTIAFDGTGDQTLSAGGGTGAVPGVLVNKARGTLEVRDTINMGGTSGWTWKKGKVDAAGSTIVFRNLGNTADPGKMSFDNVVVALQSNRRLSVTGVMDVGGNFTVKGGTGIDGTVSVAGNVTTTVPNIGGSGTVEFKGNGDQVLDAGGGEGGLPGVAVNKGRGTLTIKDTIRIGGDGGWSHTTGAVDATKSTVEFAGRRKTVSSGAMSFHHVAIGMSAGYELTMTGTMSVKGNLTAKSPSILMGGTIVVGGTLKKEEDAKLKGSTVIKVGGSTIRLEPGPGVRRGPKGRTGRTKGRVPPHLRKKGPPWTR